MEDIKIWALNGSQATPLNAVSQVESEWDLEDMLVENPDLLMDDLTLVARQVDTEGGTLDLLGVDKYGRLVVFELKRGTLRRDAVAQVIDYASDLEARDWANLCSLISKNSGWDGIETIEDFDEWYGENRPDSNPKPIRMVIVGLGADAQAERMVKFLADDNGMDISLLTFRGFKLEGKTFLAKQVEVDARATSDNRRTSVNLSQAERQDSLYQLVDECGIRGEFDSAVDVFRETWGEWVNEGPNQASLRIDLMTDGTPVGERPYVRLEPGDGEVWINFHRRAFTLCADAFKQPVETLEPLLSPRWEKNWRDANEIQFALTAEDWERHKETITALAKAVYAAWEDTVGVGESN